MSTRGAFGFRKGNDFKVTYNHSDSYPTWLLKQLLKDLKDVTATQIVNTFERVQLVNESDKPTTEQIEKYTEFANVRVGSESIDDWYCLLRDTQGTLEPWLSGKVDHMIDGRGMLDSGLYCEYAYIFNIDEMTLEVYKNGRVSDDSVSEFHIENGLSIFKKGVLSLHDIKSEHLGTDDKIEEFCQWVEDNIRETHFVGLTSFLQQNTPKDSDDEECKVLCFDILTTVSVVLSKENLAQIAELSGEDVKDLDADGIADYLTSEVDYSFDFMPEGEEPLMQSYSTQILEAQDCSLEELTD